VAENLGARTALVGAGLFAGLGIAVVTAWYLRQADEKPTIRLRPASHLRRLHAGIS
jgi:hypothetical protein